jgi:hypothetical protein
MMQMRDLKDIMLSFGDSWDYLKRQIGRFLGAALGPLIDKLSPFLYKLGDAIDKLRKTEKSLVFLAKAVIIATGAIVGLAGALGTVRLMVKLLGFAGIGLPGLSTALMIVTGLFVGLTSSADSLIDKLKIFGAFIQGIWQLITSLDTETGFAKMDKSIHDMLKRAGLLTLAQNIARIGSIVKTVVEDSIQAFTKFATFADKVFGGTFRFMKNLLDNFDQAWNIWWVSKSITPMQKFVRGAMVVLGGFFAFMVGKKAFGLLQGLLGKIPIIGKLFGGGGPLGGGPKGTATDPVYVTPTSGGLLGGAASMLLPGGMAGIGGWIWKAIREGMGVLIARIAPMLIAAAPVMGALIGVAAAGAIGYAVGMGLNSLLDKYTNQQNQYGQSSNIVERAFGKLGVMTGQISEDQYNDMYGPGNGKKQTEISVPKMPDSQVEVVDALGEQMKSLEGDKRAKFKDSFQAALDSGSPGGGLITPDEFRDAMLNALDNSSNLSVLADKAKEAKSTISPASRR